MAGLGRNKMAVHYMSERPDWGTPQDLFDDLDREFRFTHDVCASHANAKCAKYYTEDDNGLIQDWVGVCFCNPPYGREIPKWIKKAVESSFSGVTTVCLIPARTDTAWWHDFCIPYGEIRFIRGRLRHTLGGVVSDPAPFPSAVVIFHAVKKDTKQATFAMFGAVV